MKKLNTVVDDIYTSLNPLSEGKGISLSEDDDKFLVGAMGNEIIEQDLGLHYIELNDKKDKIKEHKYFPLNEWVRDMVISKNKNKIILFLETTSSLAVIRKTTN